VNAQLRQGPVQPEAVAARLVAGADGGVGRQTEALLGLGDLLLEPGEVACRQGAETRLLGRLGGKGEEPLVLAQFQGDVQGCRRGRRRGRGHGSFSVFQVTGVLPDGVLYHLGYRAAYMVSNAQVLSPARSRALPSAVSRIARRSTATSGSA